jgi:hypothetical protein
MQNLNVSTSYFRCNTLSASSCFCIFFRPLYFFADHFRWNSLWVIENHLRPTTYNVYQIQILDRLPSVGSSGNGSDHSHSSCKLRCLSTRTCQAYVKDKATTNCYFYNLDNSTDFVQGTMRVHMKYCRPFYGMKVEIEQYAIKIFKNVLGGICK